MIVLRSVLLICLDTTSRYAGRNGSEARYCWSGHIRLCQFKYFRVGGGLSHTWKKLKEQWYCVRAYRIQNDSLESRKESEQWNGGKKVALPAQTMLRTQASGWFEIRWVPPRTFGMVGTLAAANFSALQSPSDASETEFWARQQESKSWHSSWCNIFAFKMFHIYILSFPRSKPIQCGIGKLKSLKLWLLPSLMNGTREVSDSSIIVQPFPISRVPNLSSIPDVMFEN